jgi:predicted alpha/beta hydrolase
MTRLHVRTWGVGDRSVLLVHGLSAHSETWNGVGEALAQRGYRVAAPDLRGHGLSPRGSYSVREWAADILESVPAAPDLAIGHSLGAIVDADLKYSSRSTSSSRSSRSSSHRRRPRRGAAAGAVRVAGAVCPGAGAAPPSQGHAAGGAVATGTSGG